MPKPQSGESHDDFIDRCIPEVIRDGTVDSDKSGEEQGRQARAICESIWDRHDMANELNSDSLSALKSLVEEGKVNTDADWSFESSDMDALRGGDEGDNWDRVERAHLGVETDAGEKTQARFVFPVAKLSGDSLTVFRSGVIAAKQRASQTGDESIAKAADDLLQMIDSKQEHQMADNLHNMIGVEIFRAGKWNGDEFTTADLDEMVANFDKVGFRPPVKLGHTNNPDDRAFGFVSGLRRVGDKLLADFTDVPGKVVDLIKERAYDAVSSEVFFNLKRNGETFRRALAGVALLGAQVPAVSGLKPLSDALPFSADAEDTRTYRLSDAEDDDMADETKADLKRQLDEAQQQIKQLEQDSAEAKQLREQMEAYQTRLAELEEQRLKDYVEGKVRDFQVPALRPHLRFLYELAMRDTTKRTFATTNDKGEETTEDVPPETVLDRLVSYIQSNTTWLFTEQTESGGRGEDAADKVDRLAKAKQRETGKNYSESLNLVLDENPDLKREYAG